MGIIIPPGIWIPPRAPLCKGAISSGEVLVTTFFPASILFLPPLSSPFYSRLFFPLSSYPTSLPFNLLHLSLSLFLSLLLPSSIRRVSPRVISLASSIVLRAYIHFSFSCLFRYYHLDNRDSSGFSIKCLRTCHLSGFVPFLFSLCSRGNIYIRENGDWSSCDFLSLSLFSLSFFSLSIFLSFLFLFFFSFHLSIRLIVSSVSGINCVYVCVRVSVCVCVCGWKKWVSFCSLFDWWSLFSFQSKAYVQRSSSKNTWCTDTCIRYMYVCMYVGVCIHVLTCVCVYMVIVCVCIYGRL